MEILEDLGLSKGEIKVYLTLLELGSTKVGKIIEKSKLASSAVHNSLNTLTNKGLISYIKKGKIKFYQAAPAKQIVNFIEDKKKKALEILPELELKQKLAEDKQEAEIFTGMKGVITLLNEFIENTKKGDIFYFFSVDVKGMNKEIQNFFEKYDAKRKAKGLIVKGLARNELKSFYKHRIRLQVKYLDFPIPTNVSMCNNKIVLITWGDNPSGILIHSPQLYESQISFFKELWKKAKNQ